MLHRRITAAWLGLTRGGRVGPRRSPPPPWTPGTGTWTPAAAGSKGVLLGGRGGPGGCFKQGPRCFRLTQPLLAPHLLVQAPTLLSGGVPAVAEHQRGADGAVRQVEEVTGGADQQCSRRRGHRALHHQGQGLQASGTSHPAGPQHSTRAPPRTLLIAICRCVDVPGVAPCTVVRPSPGGQSDQVMRDHLSLVCLCLAVRLANALVVRTAFVPDEYWQSVEVAHRMVFG